MRRSELIIQIQSLKATKGDVSSTSYATELIRAPGYVNIIDMFLLPLYYAWDKLGFGKLEDVCFETYLSKAYILFCQSRDSYINKMLSLLRKVSKKRDLSQGSMSIVGGLIKIYSSIIIKYGI